jgi:Leucine-rich repeat (LRR) protein
LPSLHKNLEILFCYNNQLTYLPSLPKTLKTLTCFNNQLNYLPTLPVNIQELTVYYNPIYEIVNSDTLFQIKNNIRILNNFRHLYYCLKFKKQLRKWLWEKVREPKANKHFSPVYLIENLGDDDDLDTVLNKW